MSGGYESPEKRRATSQGMRLSESNNAFGFGGTSGSESNRALPFPQGAGTVAHSPLKAGPPPVLAGAGAAVGGSSSSAAAGPYNVGSLNPSKTQTQTQQNARSVSVSPAKSASVSPGKNCVKRRDFAFDSQEVVERTAAQKIVES